MILKFLEQPHIVEKATPKGAVRLVRFVVGVWLARAAVTAGNPPAAQEEFLCQILPKTKTVPVLDAGGNPTGETQVVAIDRRRWYRRVVRRWLARIAALPAVQRSAKVAALRTLKPARGFARIQGDHNDVLRDFTPESEVEL